MVKLKFRNVCRLVITDLNNVNRWELSNLAYVLIDAEDFTAFGDIETTSKVLSSFRRIRHFEFQIFHEFFVRCIV